MDSLRGTVFFFLGRRGGGIFSFFPCSHHVPEKLAMGPFTKKQSVSAPMNYLNRNIGKREGGHFRLFLSKFQVFSEEKRRKT
jgi:hypothetical protein